MSPAETRPGPFALLDGLEGSRLAANVMHFGRILPMMMTAAGTVALGSAEATTGGSRRSTNSWSSWTVSMFRAG